MKNKIVDYLSLLATVVYSLGFSITFILLFQAEKNLIQVSDQILLYLPMVILGLISIAILVIYFLQKKKYYILINMHINQKWIKLHDYGFICLMLSIVINVFMVSFLGSADTFAKIPGTNTFPNIWYLYFVVGVTFFLFIISYIIISISVFRIRVDLEIRRLGEEFSKEDINKIKTEDKNIIEKQNLTISEDFISFDNKKTDEQDNKKQ